MSFDPAILLIVLLPLPGLAVLVAGAVMLRNRAPLMWRGLKIRGRISRIERHSGSAGTRTAYTPWVTFTAPDGIERTLRLDHSPYRRPQPGGEIEIYFDPLRPERIFAISWPSLFLMPSTCVLAGILVVAIALGMYFGREPPGGWPKPEKMPFSRN